MVIWSLSYFNIFLMLNRDRVIKRERAMRRAAERRELTPGGNDADTYMDMYAGSTPSVQEELRERLDPATQRANLLRGEERVTLIQIFCV